MGEGTVTCGSLQFDDLQLGRALGGAGARRLHVLELTEKMMCKEYQQKVRLRRSAHERVLLHASCQDRQHGKDGPGGGGCHSTEASGWSSWWASTGSLMSSQSAERALTCSNDHWTQVHTIEALEIDVQPFPRSEYTTWRRVTGGRNSSQAFEFLVLVLSIALVLRFSLRFLSS